MVSVPSEYECFRSQLGLDNREWRKLLVGSARLGLAAGLPWSLRVEPSPRFEGELLIRLQEATPEAAGVLFDDLQDS